MQEQRRPEHVQSELQQHAGPECYMPSQKVKNVLRTQVQASVVLTLK